MKIHHLEAMYTREEVRSRTKELASEIYPEFKNLQSTLVILTLGGIRFGADLFDDLTDYPDLEKTMMLNSFGIISYDENGSNGKPRINGELKNPEVSIRGRHVLLVDDIRHTGTTLEKTAIPEIERHGPAKLSVATLLSADNLSPLNISGKTYAGFYMDSKKYVVGTLLDADEQMRGVKGIKEVIFEK
jgi:hypoxanthine phosphoribosyltransferase